MAEVDTQKSLTLSQQYALPEKEEKSVAVPVEVVEKEKPTEAAPEEVPENTDETPVAVEETVETPVVAEVTDEPSVTAEKTDDAPVAEESSESPEPEQSEDQEAEEQKSEIKVETAPTDFRFPTTNQTRHCFTRYVEYHRCITAKGEDASECNKFAKYYRSLCPGEWVDRWNEQRENGTFPGPL